MPVISIVLPTYNQGHFLAQALDSIFQQTFRNFELIVVNDGSTDNTVDILRAYSSRYSFQVIHQDNRGLPVALNTGFARSRGKYWTWTSSDNILRPSMLEILHAELNRDPSVGVVYADWSFIDEQGKVLGRFHTLEFDRDILLCFNFVHCCFLFRRECFETVGGYEPRFIYSEDWEFWIRVSRCFRMKRVPLDLYLYRVHRTSMTTEVIEGRAHRAMPYSQFAAYLRRRYPLSWYYGKLKWKLRKWLGYGDPLLRWNQMITQYTPGSLGNDT